MLSGILSSDFIVLNLESSDRDECLAELLEILVKQQPQINRKEALDNLMLRESKMSTAVYPDVAVPHCVCKSVKKTCIALGISKKGIDFGSTEVSPQELNAKIIFEILFEEEDTEGHLKILRDILRLVEQPQLMQSIKDAKDSQEIFGIIENSEL